jgi:hypothetical protein
VQIACRVADLLGFSVNRPSERGDLDDICAALPKWIPKRLSAQLPTLQDAITCEIRLFEGSEAPPLGSSPGVIVDNQEPEERPSAGRSPHDIPTRMTSFLNSHHVIAGGILAAIVALLSAALYLQR